MRTSRANEVKRGLMTKRKNLNAGSRAHPADGAIDSEQEGLLYDAVTGDDAAAVRRILGRHPGLRAAELPMGMSWLHLAAEEGALAAAKALVAAGLRVDEPAREDPETPLHYAAAEGHEAVARWLLDGGADVNAADKYGRTPLMNAARDGHAALAKLLLKRGADAAASYGKPPQDAMSLARSRGHDDVVRLLDAAGGGAGARVEKTGAARGPVAKAGAKKGAARGGAGAKRPSGAGADAGAEADRLARQRII